jgi:hypothetical protein
MNGLQKIQQRTKKRIEPRGGVLNKFRIWSLWFVSVLAGLRIYQHPSYIHFQFS